MTFELGPNIVFWHSNSYFNIRNQAEYRNFDIQKSNIDIHTWAENRILNGKILFCHWNWGRISYFDIQNPIWTFELVPNIVFWHSITYFDIRNQAEYRILLFKILFLHSKLGQISSFDIQNPILTFKIGPNIVFWHSKPYFDIQTGTEYRIFTFKILFDFRNKAEYRILTFWILFWHSIWGWIAYFDIQNPILTFEIGRNIVFWYSKSYLDIRTEAEYRILTFKILFWHLNLDRISYFDIQNPTLTFQLRPNIVFLSFKILFWHSNWGQISYFDIQNPIWTFEIGPISYFDILNPILTLELGPNIVFWHSKSYFDIRTEAEYRILTFKILFWDSNWGRISYFDIQNPILTFEIGPYIVSWYSKPYFDVRTAAEYRILIFKFLFWHSESGRIS